METTQAVLPFRRPSEPSGQQDKFHRAFIAFKKLEPKKW